MKETRRAGDDLDESSVGVLKQLRKRLDEPFRDIGDYYLMRDAAREIERLRERAEAAEARLAEARSERRGEAEHE